MVTAYYIITVSVRKSIKEIVHYSELLFCCDKLKKHCDRKIISRIKIKI